tara:strand:+ start:2747 stop:3064 length:318 start_codon:yes stop_codon:yes gene_type:complete
MYEITKYTFDRLEQLNKKLNGNITIEPSSNKNKKIDIFINGLKTNSIGAIKDNGVPYLDYPNYIKIKGLEYADKRRKLYYKRHSKEDDVKDNKITNSWFSRWLLW